MWKLLLQVNAFIFGKLSIKINLQFEKKKLSHDISPFLVKKKVVIMEIGYNEAPSTGL